MKGTGGTGLICPVLIWLAALAVILLITPLGAGVSPDSTAYLAGATSILAGDGFTSNGYPITKYPPLYPFTLAGVTLVESDLVQAARHLAAALFATNLGLVALAVSLATGRDKLAAAGACLFCAVSAPMLELHAWAWSEPLFIALSLACVILLSGYTIRRTPLLFATSSLALAAAIMTRYIGLAFLPAALVLLVIVPSDQPLGRRCRTALAWAALACAPLVGLAARNVTVEGVAVARSLEFHPMALDLFIGRVVDTVAGFVVPPSISSAAGPILLGLLAAALAAQLVIAMRRQSRTDACRSLGAVLPLTAVLFTVSYLLGLLASISLVDASTPVDTRLLSPVLFIMVLAVFVAQWHLAMSLKAHAVWWCFLLLAAACIAARTPEALQTAGSIREDGLGFTSRAWSVSETVAYVRGLAPGVRIYSNAANALGYLTGSRPLSIPAKFWSTTALANTGYAYDISAVCKDIEDGRALLVYLQLMGDRWFLPTAAELEEACPSSTVKRFSDGIVLGAVP